MSSTEECCPKCGSELISGYGLMGGGVGAYAFCESESCDYFVKMLDTEQEVA